MILKLLEDDMVGIYLVDSLHAIIHMDAFFSTDMVLYRLLRVGKEVEVKLTYDKDE